MRMVAGQRLQSKRAPFREPFALYLHDALDTISRFALGCALLHDYVLWGQVLKIIWNY